MWLLKSQEVLICFFMFTWLWGKTNGGKVNRRQSGIATDLSPNSSERACFSLSYTVNTRQATPLSVQCAKPQEFPLSVFLSPFLFQSLSLIPAFSDRPMRDTGGMTTETARISFFPSTVGHSSQDCPAFFLFVCLSHIDLDHPTPPKGCVLKRP